jgi:cytochrome c556
MFSSWLCRAFRRIPVKKSLIALSVVVASVAAAYAADDPIAVRKALMQGVGASAGVSGAMMKSELPYSPAIGKAAIASINASAQAFGDYFPEGSDMGADTTASPKIWEDRAGFDDQIAKLQAAIGAAVQASGKDGPADLAAFQAAIGPVFDRCKECHEGYRVKQ